MTDRQVLEEAKRAISVSFERNSSMCAPFLSVIPVTGAAISFLGTMSAQSTLCASDDTAAHLDELQFDLGEGPCWEAMNSGQPAIHPDIQQESRPVWPAFAAALRDTRVGAMFAFPLTLSTLEIGAVDLYCDHPETLTPGQVADAWALSRVAAWQVLRRVLSLQEGEDEGSQYSRREVHQATGMIIAQLDVSAENASLLLKAHAFSKGRSVREISNDIVERRLSFADAFGHDSSLGER
jgi:hypothetical protein